MKERDKTIDFLRGVSIILIVLIHVLSGYASNAFSSILGRYLHFVEVLLVFCSGASLAYSHGVFKGAKEVFNFTKKRLARFYIPWWLFLVAFLSMNFVFDYISGNPFRYTYGKIMQMLFLFGVGGAMGYGWILLLLLFLSLISPFLIQAAEKTGYEKMFFLLVLFSFIMHYLHSFGLFESPLDTIFYLQYLLPFFLGIIYAKRKKLNLLLFSFSSLALHILIGYLLYSSGANIVFTDYKYPPNLFFISYGIFMALLLILVFRLKRFRKLVSNKISDFYSLNSLWIYMWHILVLGVVYRMFLPYGFMNDEPWWLVKFATVLAICTLIVLLQNFLYRRIKNYINAGINYNMH